MITVLLTLFPSLFSQESSLRRPFTATFLPFLRYLQQVSACAPQTVTSINRVSSVSFRLVFIARRSSVTEVPPLVVLSSGSCVRLPATHAKLKFITYSKKRNAGLRIKHREPVSSYREAPDSFHG